MWNRYTKIFIFRDCFDSGSIDGNLASINELMQVEQNNGEYGVFITSDVLSTSIANRFEASRDDDDGTWNLDFYYGNQIIATVSTYKFKEIQLVFEVEEEIESGRIVIHYCTVKGFKEYQM